MSRPALTLERSRARPFGLDDAMWEHLESLVATQPVPPPCSQWRSHSRLASATADGVSASSLMLAHDSLVLPWLDGSGVWRNPPAKSGGPCVVKRFLRAPTLAAWRAYEQRLARGQRCFYEVLREGTPCRYWLDFDLNLDSEALLLRLGLCRGDCADALARLLEQAAVSAVCATFAVQPAELEALSVDGNGASTVPRLSLHVIVHGALLPDNEHAAAAVRLAVIAELHSMATRGVPLAAALLEAGIDLASVVDAVNTRNRLRRLTGHTKALQKRWSAPLARHAVSFASRPGACYVSGAAAGDTERVLAWRDSLVRRLQPRSPLAPRRSGNRGAPCMEALEDAINAELGVMALLGAAPRRAVRVLPPSAQYPCYAAFTDCPTCPWRAQDSPQPGRASGPAHRSARVFITFFAARMEVGCTASRHSGKISLPYALPTTQEALFPAQPLHGSMDKLLMSPPPAEAMLISPPPTSRAAGSPFLLQNLADIFSPSFA